VGVILTDLLGPGPPSVAQKALEALRVSEKL